VTPFIYPQELDLRIFVEIITNKKYEVSKYLPAISEEWFKVVFNCINYVQTTSQYDTKNDFHSCCARLLYKVAKRHELSDGNKRSAVIAVYLFAILNDYNVSDPQELKVQARRAAKSKGRNNEDMLKRRIAEVLVDIIEKL